MPFVRKPRNQVRRTTIASKLVLWHLAGDMQATCPKPRRPYAMLDHGGACEKGRGTKFYWQTLDVKLDLKLALTLDLKLHLKLDLTQASET